MGGPQTIGVVTETRVDAVVVGGVVAVSPGGEDRAERDTGRTEFHGVVEPVDEAAQPVLVGPRGVLGGEYTDEAQGVDVPPDHVLDPRRRGHGRNLAA